MITYDERIKKELMEDYSFSEEEVRLFTEFDENLQCAFRLGYLFCKYKKLRIKVK